MENRSRRSPVCAQASPVCSSAASVHPGLIADGPDWLFLLCARLAAWRADRRQRCRLLRLSDHLLRDVGLTPADIGLSGSRHWPR